MQSRFVAYATLPHFTPVVAVVAVTAILALIIDGSSSTDSVFVRLLLAMLGGQVVVGVANELVDAETDRMTKPSKPIPSGLVSVRGAAALGAAGLVMMMVAGVSLGAVSFLILLAGTGAGMAYSLWFKQSRFAWLPYLVALPLIPVWVAVSLDRFEPELLVLFPLGALAVLGVQIAQSVPDIEPDRAAGIDSVTTRLGERRSLVVCWASVVGSLMLALIVVMVQGSWRWWMVLPGLVVAGLVTLDVVLYRRNGRSGVMAAFPCVAAAAGILALGWVASIYR
jgi:4-hydroxybenzoate polyprenyltransferase